MLNEKAQISPALKNKLTEQVKSIYWKNKIAATTTNITAGEVLEIEIFEIKLHSKNLDEKILQMLDKLIPYHNIFVLCYENFCKICAAYRGENDAVSRNYFSTDWADEKNLSLEIKGLTTDEVYKNFLQQIDGKIFSANVSTPIKNIVENAEKIKNLEKQIAALEKKIYKEKQFNRQMEMNRELMNLQKELAKLKS